MPPVTSGQAELAALIKELKDLQSSMFDKASAYTKLVFGIGYAGFFTAWSGSKAHLGPKVLLWSALLITISLVLYLLFEIYQTAVISYIGIDFARTMATGTDLANELTNFRRRSIMLSKPLYAAWFVVFPASLLTGLAGAFVLIAAFVSAVLRLP